MADWNIRPRAVVCSDCEKPFSPQMTGHTLLIRTEEGFLRKDLCPTCFKQHPNKDGVFTSAAWSFKVPAESTRSARKEEPVRKETAIQLLRKLIAREQRDDIGVIYILSILLERNKQFIERDVRQQADGPLTRVYEFKPTGEIFLIEDPKLNSDNLVAVQQRVIDILEGRETLSPTSPLKRARPLRKTRAAFRCTTLLKRYKKGPLV